MKTVYRNGKPYGEIIEPDGMTIEQLLEVFNSAMFHIVKLPDGEYSLIEDDDLCSDGPFNLHPAEEDVKN